LERWSALGFTEKKNRRTWIVDTHEENKRQCATQDELLSHSVNELVRKHPKAFYNLTDEGAKELMENFIKAKLADFPNLCIETRRVNWLRRKQLKEMDNAKGWSPKKNFKLDYVIPRELYMFMINMVYRKFWAEEEERAWRSFMKAIMRGDDSTALLRKVKVYYGARAHQTE
jgi:hypothetical protein